VLPDRKAIKSEIVTLLEENGALEIREMYRHLRKRLHLSEHDLDETTNGGENFFEKEVRWAKKDLVDNGTIKRPAESGHGTWELAATPPIIEDLSPILCDSPAELEEQLSRISPTSNRPEGQKSARKISVSTEAFSRDARVVAFVLKEAAGACEACAKPSPFFRENEEPFLEVHHLRPLADGGSDTVENVIGACPNCHRELHHGKNRHAIKKILYSKIGRLVEE
jgi:5-methylcytosine-specific restriction enzyme A